jgi:hypothetical protein
MKQADGRIEHHRTRIIGTIAAAHFLLSVAFFFLSMASSMSRFDGAGPSDLTALLLNGAFETLWFPLALGFTMLKIANTGVWGWIPVLANSVLWGWAGWRAIRFLRSRHGGALENP